VLYKRSQEIFDVLPARARRSSASVSTPTQVSAQPSRLLDKAITGGFLATLIVATLAHGAVEPWSVALFEFMLTGLVLMWSIQAVRERHLHISVPATAFPILALLGLALVQSIAFNGPSGERISLSMDVEATRHAVTMILFLAIAFMIAANFLTTERRLILTANVLTLFGALIAAFALIQYFAWDGRLYWVRPTSSTVFGPFVNRNHFAGYMDMIMPIPLGLILTVIRGHARIVYGFAAALMGTATVVSNSRSGMISMVVAIGMMAALNRWTRRSSSLSERHSRNRLMRIGPIALISLAMVVGVFWIGAVPVVEHFGDAADALLRSGTPDVGRSTIWRDTVRMIQDYPVSGIGFGAYKTVYPAYAESAEFLNLEYAHNDYLQAVAEGGLIAALILISFLVLTITTIHRGIRSANPLLSGLALAAGCGIVAVGVQSLSDTDLQIPSNALLFIVLSAIVWRASVREVVWLKHTMEDEQ